MLRFIKRIFARLGHRAGGMPPPGRLGVDELARRLGVSVAQLRGVAVAYRPFEVPKRGGGTRTLLAPAPPLKAMQRRILRRLLARLAAHPCATGFERGQSIVTNARPHVGQDVVIRLDLVDFFGSTRAARVEGYFRRIGWDADTARLLTELCTYGGALPQGAPTSPRLSNLVNVRLDARLYALAAARGCRYTRYADDLTFSGPAVAAHDARTNPKTLESLGHGPARVNDVIRAAKRIVADEGYQLHTAKKLRVCRRADRQLVTGLVVNERVNLPRATRRRLRAIAHHLRTGQGATLTPAQMAGWDALRAMIDAQSSSPPSDTAP